MAQNFGGNLGFSSRVKAQLTVVEGGGHGMNMYSEENLAKMVAFLNDIRLSK